MCASALAAHLAASGVVLIVGGRIPQIEALLIYTMGLTTTAVTAVMGDKLSVQFHAAPCAMMCDDSEMMAALITLHALIVGWVQTI